MELEREEARKARRAMEEGVLASAKAVTSAEVEAVEVVMSVMKTVAVFEEGGSRRLGGAGRE